ncbi:methyltransferase [Coccidioides immitis RMSCC 2394]|uniref:Methyltransferase n=1 Tax=Coccidioides immitis RMSCC 2394 TaxID=404692 RepID=A0A0J6Y9L5_COCIT|nr:methyltransferase [Coccidioides immitis RMSCC 2394]
MQDPDNFSLTESVFDYEYENGRRYHAYHAGEYPLPNDEKEQDRLDMQHHLYTLLYDGDIYRAPISKDIKYALDIGCGTGIWAIEFADKFPNTEVIATDLSAIQPGVVPENLQFEVDDAEDEWQFSHTFDYIHLGTLAGSIADWPRLLQQAYDNLAPGGWIELIDFEAWASTDDDSLPPDSAYAQFQTLLADAARKFGKELNLAARFREMVEEAGFVNVVDERRKAPLSPWPADPRLKTLGEYMRIVMADSLEPYCLALFTRVLDWNNTMIQAQLAGVRQDLRNMDFHIHTTAHCVYGQKPFS